MLRGNLTRTRGKLHSLSHSTDHMSLDVVDHVPSTIPESSFPAIFFGQRSSHHSYDHTRSQSQFGTRVTNSPCRLVLANLDSSVSIRYVRTTEQVADILRKGASTTIQWKSLLQLFDVQRPPKLDVERSFLFLNHLFLLSLTPHRMFTILSATSKMGLGKRT